MFSIGFLAAQQAYYPLPTNDLAPEPSPVARPEAQALEAAQSLKSKEITPPGSYADPGHFVTTISHPPESDPVGKYLKQKLGNLKLNIRNSIYGFIWRLAGSPQGNPRFGEVYAHADSYRLFQAMQQAGAISSSEDILAQLPEKAQNQVYRRVYDHSPHHNEADPKWGENHAKDNQETLTRALFDLGFVDTQSPDLSTLLGTECAARDQKTDTLHKVQVAHSVKGQKSFKATISLRATLVDNPIYTTHHTLHHNSSVNGQSYIDASGNPVFIHDAISSSNDRTTDRLVNARVVTNNQGESLAYTGRSDTPEKAKEQADMIFLSEKNRLTPNADGTYELTYMVNSLLTPSWTTRFSPFNEKKSTLNQRAALKELHEKGLVEVKDPKTGRIYKVKFNPIFFSRPFNIYTQLEKFLPDSFTGRNLAKEVSQEGYEALEPLIGSNTRAREYFDVLNTRGSELDAEKELMLRILLAKELKMPVVCHCKSSTDRTAIAIALAATMDQFQQQGKDIFVDDDYNVSDEFKELFMANALAGHQITSMARSAMGPVDGVELHDNNFGFSWGKQWMTNPSIGRLSPDRYLEDIKIGRDLIKPMLSKVGKMKAWQLAIIAFFALVFFPLTLIALGFAAWNASTFLVDKKWKEDHSLQIEHRIVGSSGSNFKLAKKAMKSK